MWLNRRKNIPIEHRSLEFLAEPPSPGSFLTQDLHEGPEATSSAEGVTASSPAPSLSEVVIDSDYATDEEHAPVPLISRRTTPEQVVFHLTDRNCKDLSSSIDHANCNGTEVAIKLLRYSEDSEDDSGTEPKHFRIHGDLKGANILVSDAGTPVLTDFGSSFLTAATLNFTTTGKRCSFTTRWSAPEIIDETSQHTEASDVYALGMTIYEIMTGKPPYHNKRESNVIRLVTVKREPPERLECLRGDCEKSESLWQLLLRCWSFEPAKRPSAAEVADTLKIMLI
ncbi:STE20/SPS1-related proline-alanine-rich protein kinase Short=Ste-20-related kinase [Rhizoctonia solani AG-1 IB]|uniref:STE20/SPS1-related proline-alanine-rich protein kinase Short=Ste-20-related kinase n=1 Tax=Thanatephorus cucumeris (strain AG1-IB / isolate 7/3/14) TaxID=1108050 RepID=M5C9Y0_THACB|nr:STE20/SPS1-related proline-alanine-rich protein kinase Short=Ste-20-related kinase [Rhizoctonia solani AG-1 IB]